MNRSRACEMDEYVSRIVAPDIIWCNHNATLSNSVTLDEIVVQWMASFAEIPICLGCRICQVIFVRSYLFENIKNSSVKSVVEHLFTCCVSLNFHKILLWTLIWKWMMDRA